jgi:hypothetical protein
MHRFQTIASLTGVTIGMQVVLIAACAVPETSTIDTCPWQTDSNTTDRNETVLTHQRSHHYSGDEPFCGSYTRKRLEDFDTFHQYMLYQSRLTRIRMQTRDQQLISRR